MSKHTDDREHAQLVKLLPLVSGKVNAVLAKKGKWTENELRERTVQFGPASFSYHDVISFAEIFSLVDTDGSGQISALEVKHLMNLLGEDVELAEVETLIHEFDIDGSGEVDLTEFIFVLALQRRTDYKREDVLRAFDMFAKPVQGRKGVVNKDVLRHALLQYGSSAASEKEIHKLVDMLPASEGGATNEFDYAKHVNLFMG